MAEEKAKCLMGDWTISDGILLVKPSGKQFSVNIIQADTPATDKSEEEHDTFCKDLEQAWSPSWKNIILNQDSLYHN